MGKLEPTHHPWPVCKRSRFYIAIAKLLSCNKLPIAHSTCMMKLQMSAKCAFRLMFYNHFWQVQFLYGKWFLSAPMSFCDCNVSLRICLWPNKDGQMPNPTVRDGRSPVLVKLSRELPHQKVLSVFSCYMSLVLVHLREIE